MVAAAAAAVVSEMVGLIDQRGRAIGIFDALRPGFSDALVEAPGVEWTRVVGFHVGEYLGMDQESPGSCRKLLLDRLVMRVPMIEFHGMRGEAANPEAVCLNYAALLRSRPPDFAALEIGKGGRIGFNDRANCDFEDPAAVRVVEIEDERHRRAMTLTVLTIMACPRLFLTAAEPIDDRMIEGPITPACPASILRTHPDAHLFLEIDRINRILED